MTDTTNISDHCVIRWGAGVSTEARGALLARAAKLGKAKRGRPYKPNYPKERELAESRGLRTILADDSPEATSGAVWIVRIYYRSMGGELLACQTAPISGAAASRLESEYAGGPTDALGTDKYRADEPGRIPPLWKGARLVTLPSQNAQPVERHGESAQETIPVEIATPCQAPPREPTPTPCAEPPRREPLTFYHQAMARRTARVGTHP